VDYIEALRVAREALEVIRVSGEGNGWTAHQALVATTVVDPVVVSINSERFDFLLYCRSRASSEENVKNCHSTLVQYIDQHCAALVAQAVPQVLPLEPVAVSDNFLPATTESPVVGLKADFDKKRLAAERAAYAWFCECDVGPERERASDIYENIRCATRV
jgi:hypothetical protein